MSATTQRDLADLPSQYDHQAAQARWYAYWEERGYFHARPDDERPPFTIVIPPPNVTGALHLGHALNNTLQDILVRMKRMQGFNTLWMPGTDHAGIATQAVVERRLLEEEGKSRHELGREGLVDRIWEWKKQYETRILGQLKQLGCSCDWERLRFTLDEVCGRAVRETFFRLFQDGKIYRGNRLVNWDPFLQTAVSDDEVFHETVRGNFWHFHYRVVDPQAGEPAYVSIATTRPETMLGDTAVAVHPEPARQLDKVEADLQARLAAAAVKDRPPIQVQLDAVRTRRREMLPKLEQLTAMARAGRMLHLPLTGRQIPLIVDPWAKPELGSGCVKITPAHDENDYQVWQRHPHIGAINIMLPDGTLGDQVPAKYRGLSMKKARAAVLNDLADEGNYDPERDVEDREIDLAHSDRSKTPIEPYLADQWFVRMDELAQSAMDAVEKGRVKITPSRYAKGYLDWLSEKRDWPIGRQLWWGHRIPVWRMTVRDDATPGGDPQQLLAGLLAGFARALGIADELAIAPQEDAPRSFYVCARTDAAVEGLTALHARHHGDTSDSDDSQLTATQRQAEERLWEALEAMSPQEEEVLDTWFSSALWPHSTLGWPARTPELERFYPGSTLVTSRDIITLWVARMVLTGLYNLGEVPFREVYIHPKILDGFGETMSKSKGNGVDPLDVIDKFGADALRFGIAYLTTETQDVRMPVEFECPHCQTLIHQTKKNRTLPRIECDKCGQPFGTQWSASHGTPQDNRLPRAAVVSERFDLGRRFCNKLWNAARFSLMNLDGYEAGEVAHEELTLEDRWLLSRLATVTNEVTGALAKYQFSEAARSLYAFAWNDFCDYYVEITKARFDDPQGKPIAQRVLAHVLDTLLRLLHPMVPFLTEEVWQLLADIAPQRGVPRPAEVPESVCVAPWPVADSAWIDADIESQFADFQSVLAAVREIRMGQNIPPKQPLEFCLRCTADVAGRLEAMRPYFRQIARATAVALGPQVTAPGRSVSKSLPGMEVHVDVSAFFDVDAERARLTKERDQLAVHASTIGKKLHNESFVSRAPSEVVQGQRDKLAEIQQQLAAVEQQLAGLDAS
jgi:valyl-tRNA synthetase